MYTDSAGSHTLIRGATAIASMRSMWFYSRQIPCASPSSAAHNVVWKTSVHAMKVRPKLLIHRLLVKGNVLSDHLLDGKVFLDVVPHRCRVEIEIAHTLGHISNRTADVA